MEDPYHFLISMINKNKIKLLLYSDIPCDDDSGDFNDDDTMKLTEVAEFLTLLLFRRLFHS